MSDSDASDSDYDPTQEKEAESGNEQEHSDGLGFISTYRKRKADELWKEMLHDDAKEVSKKMKVALKSTTAKKGMSKTKKQKIDDMMSAVFGKRKPVSVVAIAEENESAVGSSDIRDAVSKVQKRTKVTETKKFAGSVMKIQKSVMSGKKEEVTKKPTGGLDQVLEAIKGPQTVSTVTKSSMDWENYKEKEGLEEDLEKASKDGYLHRKDFLERCDVRAFENEKETRLRNALKK